MTSNSRVRCPMLAMMARNASLTSPTMRAAKRCARAESAGSIGWWDMAHPDRVPDRVTIVTPADPRKRGSISCERDRQIDAAQAGPDAGAEVSAQAGIQLGEPVEGVADAPLHRDPGAL